jgi:hypothetical protein
VPHGIVEQDCDLARRGGDRLGLADARREPPVEDAECGLRQQAQQCRSAPAGAARSRRQHFAFGALVARRQAQPGVKCFALDREARSWLLRGRVLEQTLRADA